jgi:hypothetical protein
VHAHVRYVTECERARADNLIKTRLSTAVDAKEYQFAYDVYLSNYTHACTTLHEASLSATAGARGVTFVNIVATALETDVTRALEQLRA